MSDKEEDQDSLTLSGFGKEVLAGFCGGSAGLVVSYPFDTMKVVLQTSSAKQTIPSCVSMIWKEEGMKGFFRGMQYPLVTVAAQHAVFFGSNYLASKAIGTTDENLGLVAATAGIGGGIQALVITPVELVKVKLQAQLNSTNMKDGAHQKFTGPWNCLSMVYKTHGLRGCYRGVTSTLARDITGFAIYITAYVKLKSVFGVDSPGEGDSALGTVGLTLLAGGTAGSMSWLNFPIDTIKSRMQNDNFKHPAYKNSWHCFTTVVAKEGWMVLWKGFTPGIVRAFPHNAVLLYVYDWTTERLNQK